MSRNYEEALKIDKNYIINWEKMHDTIIGNKSVEDLTVCYLSGPEPYNDFNELISFGILPHNIWAFENDGNTFEAAINSMQNYDYPQPKIINTSMEQFFKATPKKFDIIYVDACGSIISSKHTLRIISTLFKFHRLKSPGVLITNFSEPDTSKKNELDEFSSVIAIYMYFKNNSATKNYASIKEVESEILILKELIKSDFKSHYSEFITRLIMDISSVIVPSQRFVESNYFQNVYSKIDVKNNKNYSLKDLMDSKNNSILQFLLFCKIYSKNFEDGELFTQKINRLINEFESVEKGVFTSLESLLYINNLKRDEDFFTDEYQTFKKNLSEPYYHQFLDSNNESLFVDLLINQLSYPMHYNTNLIKRFRYKAKSNNMYLDAIVFDECRYIYEWVPSLHLLKKAFENPSWQYTFRFALDGLVKNRLMYNNEFFYQSSVVNKSIKQFQEKIIDRRMIINE